MEFIQRFKRHRLAVVGAIIVFLLLITAVFAPFIAPEDPFHVDLANPLSPPTWKNPLGTDHLGRDILSRIIYGTRVSFIVGIGAVGIAAIIGGLCGLFAGYFGKKVDIVIMRALDVIWAFPPILLALAFVAVRGASLSAVILAIGLVAVPRYARIVRGTVLSIKEKDYILAAYATGISHLRIIFTHVLPNVTAPVIVVASLGTAGAIMMESILSYLGLGMQPPASSWGLMISEGQKYLRTFPYYSLFPGLMIMLIVFALNVFGDGLRDAWDPKLKT
ncbi:MAG: ABC transporter permease [Deltaproteobacteria bacterium]|nr:ABC transporter permease [Deltaproteobacteria bacterium]MBW2136475.1 ABC transporter permease [Deltaproteobacteria bacterium]